MHDGTHVGLQSIEGAERRQLEPLTYEVVDGDIDQIGRVVRHLGGMLLPLVSVIGPCCVFMGHRRAH